MIARRAALFGGLVVVLSLSGCGHYAPRDLPVVGDPDDVVGTWVHTDDGGDQVTLEVRADGSVGFTDVPRELGEAGSSAVSGPECYERLDASTDRISGEGTWESWGPDHYEFELGELSDVAVAGGFLDFSRLHFFCTDPDYPRTYTFDRQE